MARAFVTTPANQSNNEHRLCAFSEEVFHELPILRHYVQNG